MANDKIDKIQEEAPIPKPRETSIFDRRDFIMVLMSCAAFGSVGKKAHAQEPGTHPDPYSEKLHGTLGERGLAKYFDEQGRLIPEKMSDDEVKLMNKSMGVISKRYLQPSFLMYSTPIGKREDVKKALLSTVEFAGKLHYQINQEGALIIGKRPGIDTSLPADFKIVIEGDYITEVNGERMNTDALRDWEKEWAEVQERIEEINSKIRDQDIPKTDRDNQWYEYYSLKLPVQLYELLKAKKARLKPEEKRVYLLLGKMLKDHPRTLAEMDGDEEKGIEPKIAWFYTARGLAPYPLPKNMIELVHAFWFGPDAFTTFAVFRLDGTVMKNNAVNEDEKPIWVPSK